MIQWQETYKSLQLAGTQHAKLKKRFDAFALAFQEKVAEENFEVPGIIGDIQLGADFFVIHFVGRAIRCEFRTKFDAEHHYIGTVDYCIDRPIENEGILRIELGGFSFRTNGETSETDQDGMRISLDDQIAHLLLNFHYMRLSLEH